LAFIVDGNNVMGQTPGWHRDKPAARRDLVRRLADFARTKKARVTVVFDGEPDRLMPEASAFRGVKILYSDRGSDADTRIKNMVEASSDPRGLKVVTSDRHLAFLVRSRGAAVIRSGEFRRQMEEAAQSDNSEQDREKFEADDLDEWLRYFGATPDE
jgi:predicted RNA-binding protein with PIN domain